MAGIIAVESFGFQATPADFLNDKATPERPFQWNAALGLGFGAGAVPLTGQITFNVGLGTSYAVGILTTHLAEAWFGVGISVAATKQCAFAFYDSSTQTPFGGSAASQIMVVFDAANGTAAVWRGPQVIGNGPIGSVLLGTSANNVFSSGVRFFCEVHFVINGSTGSVNVYVNGTSVLNLTAHNTQWGANAYFDSIALGGFQHDLAGNIMDSLYLGDSTTGLQWPKSAVYALFPNAAGSLAQFSPNPNTNFNYQNVNQRFDGDTTYNANAGTVGNEDNFDLTPLPTGVTPGFVQATVVQRQDAAGSEAMQTVLRSGATAATGTSVVGSTTYASQRSGYATDPADGAWTFASVNALKVGYKESA